MNLRFFVSVIMLITGITTLNAQSADEIIQKNIFASGGIDNWKKINSIRSTGTITAGDKEIPVTITILNKKGTRLEYRMNGLTGYSILTVKNGWTFNPFAGQTKPEPLSEETVKLSQDGLDVEGDLMGYKAKGHKVSYIGKDTAQGTECYKLKVILASSKEETMFISTSDYYLIRSVQEIKANDKITAQTVNYSNYQILPEGIAFPMSLDNGNGFIAIDKVEINIPVDEHIFQPGELSTESEK